MLPKDKPAPSATIPSARTSCARSSKPPPPSNRADADLPPGPSLLNTLPLELIDWIADLLTVPRDRVAFAATCKALWTRIGRDWPLRLWTKYLRHRMVNHPSGTAPLFRFLGARRGQPGHLPFAIRTAERAPGPDGKAITITAMLFLQADLHHSKDVGTEEWVARGMEHAALSGRPRPFEHSFGWEEMRGVMVSAPVEWIRENCACEACAGRRREAQQAKKVTLKQTTLCFGPRKPKGGAAA